MHRRGFLGALAGLPIAAVVQPRIAAPEVMTPAPLVGDVQQPQITVTINAMRPALGDCDELARIATDRIMRDLRSRRMLECLR